MLEVRAFVRLRRYVSVSWGKDSVVTAAIARRVSASIPIAHVRCPTSNPDSSVVRDAYLADWPTPYTEHAHDREPPTDAAFFDPLAPLGCRITGIRSEESSSRRLSAATHGPATLNTCRPILGWALADVFAYLIWRDLPIHPAYAMTMGGLLDPGDIRVDVIGEDRGGERRRSWERCYYGDILASLA